MARQTPRAPTRSPSIGKGRPVEIEVQDEEDTEDRAESRIGRVIRDPNVLALMAALREETGLIRHDDLEKVITPEKRPFYYSLVNRAMKGLLREGIVFEVERGVGYQRQDISGAVAGNDKFRKRNLRNSKRGLDRLNKAVWGRNISQEDAWTATAQQAVFTMTRQMNSKHTLETMKNVARSTVSQDVESMADAMRQAVGGLNMMGRKRTQT